MKIVGNPDYLDYLAGPAWREKRQQRLEHDGHRCYRCKSTDRLEVHHITYERVGRERLTDLLTLCRDCHRKDHGRDPSLPEVFHGSGAHMRERRALEYQQEEALEAVAEALGLGEDVVDRQLASADRRGLLAWRP